MHSFVHGRLYVCMCGYVFTGAVSFWDYEGSSEEGRMKEDSKTHRTALVNMVWSASGDRLISADDNGKV